MSRARGTLSDTHIDRDYLHKIGILSPPRGEMLKHAYALRDWLQARCCKPQTQWGEDDRTVYCFSDPDDAEAFRVAFDGVPGRPLRWARPKRAHR